MNVKTTLDELPGSKRRVADSTVSYHINIESGANIQIVFIDKLEEIEDLIVDNHGNIK